MFIFVFTFFVSSFGSFFNPRLTKSPAIPGVITVHSLDQCFRMKPRVAYIWIVQEQIAMYPANILGFPFDGLDHPVVDRMITVTAKTDLTSPLTLRVNVTTTMGLELGPGTPGRLLGRRFVTVVNHPLLDPDS